MQVTIIVSGDKETMNRVKRLGENLLHLNRAMNRIGQDAVEYYSGRGWSSRGGVFHAIWPELAPSTIAARSRGTKRGNLPVLARTNMPLEVSGDMRKGFIYHAGQSTVNIGNSMPYFVYHQSSAPRTHLPRRQMMGINNPIKDIIRKAIKDDIDAKIRGL